MPQIPNRSIPIGGPISPHLGDGAAEAMEDLRGASWAPRKPAFANGNGHVEALHHGGNGAEAPVLAPQGEASPQASIEALRAAARDSVRALTMVRAYRVRGHMESDLDPLGLKPIKPHADLDPATYGFTEADMDRPIFVNNVFGLETATLRELIARVRATYCGKIGVEFMHIQDPAQRAWIQDRIESILNQTEFTDRGKRAILERLTAAEVFERFLDRKYTGTKRFGLDGGETLIPAMEQIVKRGSQLGITEVVLGMTHRGRLNVLANFMGKPFAAIFSEFQGNPANPEDVQGSADVKYHLGTSADREFDGKVVHLSLTANPSHLEAADTVVLGKVRAKQQQKKDTERQHCMALMLHGDASFAGQGLVAETLDLSDLKGYRTGGTIHLIINNQIGFTTNPVQSRSGPYCSEAGKIVQAPILHVNGDDPEAVVHVARIATEFRQQFKKDIIVDMFCYRRFGHNEGDEPAFTQPLMYRTIAKHPTTRAIYAERLLQGRHDCRRCGRAAGGRLPAKSRTRIRQRHQLQAEQGGLAGRRLVGHGNCFGRRPARRYRGLARIAARRRPGNRSGPGRFPRQQEGAAPAGEPQADGRNGREYRLGHGRGAGLRHAAGGRNASAPFGPGCRAAAPSPSAMRC